MALWLLSIVATVIALLAYVRARQVGRRLQRLSQSYWELRYECSQLEARLARPGATDSPADAVGRAASPPPVTAFVPLSSIRR